jgi:hypothetical protein
VIKNYKKYIRKIKSRIAMAKALFNRNKTYFIIKLEQWYTCSIASYRDGIWKLRKTKQKVLESSEMWCKRWMEEIIWTDHLRNEEILRRVKDEKISYIKRG